VIVGSTTVCVCLCVCVCACVCLPRVTITEAEVLSRLLQGSGTYRVLDWKLVSETARKLYIGG